MRHSLAVITVVCAAVSPLLALAASPIPAPLVAAEAFSVDDVHSSALFRIHHLGAGQFWGRFNDVEGTFTVNDGNAEGVTFDVKIKVASVDTGNKDLDKHLMGPDFFDAEAFPLLAFKSTAVKSIKPGFLEVTGDLSMHGVTKPTTAIVEWTGTKRGPMGLRAGYEAILTVKRSEWGMMYGVGNGAIGDEVRVIVSLEGTSATDSPKPEG